MLDKEESWVAYLQGLINWNDHISPPCDLMCRFGFVQVHSLLVRKNCATCKTLLLCPKVEKVSAGQTGQTTPVRMDRFGFAS